MSPPSDRRDCQRAEAAKWAETSVFWLNSGDCAVEHEFRYSLLNHARVRGQPQVLWRMVDDVPSLASKLYYVVSPSGATPEERQCSGSDFTGQRGRCGQCRQKPSRKLYCSVVGPTRGSDRHPIRVEGAMEPRDRSDYGLECRSPPGTKLPSGGIVHEVSPIAPSVAFTSVLTAVFNMEARIREQGIGSGVSLQDPVVGLDLAPEVSRMERIPSPAAVTPGETSSAGGQRAAQASAVGDSEKTRRRRRESAKQRASQACLRCRKQKLRCLGGDPCLRCVKRRIPCNFKGKDLQHADEYEVTARDRNADADPVTGELALGGFASFPGLFDDLVAYTLPHNPGALTKHLPPSTNSGSLPPPTHTRPLEPPRLGVNLYTTVSPTSTHRGASSTADKTPAGSVGFTDGSAHVGGRENDALQTGPTESLYEAPFRRLIRQVSAPLSTHGLTLGSRGATHPNLQAGTRSPDFGMRLESTRSTTTRSIPVLWIPLSPRLSSNCMFNIRSFSPCFSFVNHCHPFLPIINITQEDAFASVRGSAPLFSAVISTASRFYSKYGSRRGPSGPALDGSIPARLANLAEAHLGQTLLRRHYALSDVQAILLLAAWGLQSGGKSGPDPWVVTGSEGVTSSGCA